MNSQVHVDWTGGQATRSFYLEAQRLGLVTELFSKNPFKPQEKTYLFGHNNTISILTILAPQSIQTTQ